MEAVIVPSPKLTYSDFMSVDRACFPNEPPGTEAGFAEMVSGEVWGAYVDKALVGFSYFAIREVGHLHRIAVLPAHRRNGVGTRLLEAGIDHCRKHRVKKVFLRVQTDNTAALQMYAKHGFVCVDHQYSFVAPLRGTRGSTATELQAVQVTALPERSRAQLPAEWDYMANMHAPPRQLVLALLDRQGVPRGMARLAPDFPGCMPFVLQQPSVLLPSAVTAVARHVDPKYDGLILTFADDSIAQACRKLGFPFRYGLSGMEMVLA
jgi:[ribosomal protein S18]-alanine N-acetyltransferase